MIVAPAERYAPADDLWVVTTYFDAAGYRRKRANYETFRERVTGSGLRLVTIECAFGDRPFVLPPCDGVLQVRADHVMWQKERLLNLLVRRLPAACEKLAWLDCDVLFENPDWAAETSRRLDSTPLVQPFARAIRLPRDGDVYRGEGIVYESLAATLGRDPSAALEGEYATHGDTGLAWAARRDVLDRHGLYEACIVGGGDHLIAHAACGAWASPCLAPMLGNGQGYRAHFTRWAERFHREVHAAIGVVPGAVLHLWHGEPEHRRYVERHAKLRAFSFDPERDLRTGPGGCWEWASDKPELHAWVERYFHRRREDGDSVLPEEAG
jgi:hypothetical protein